MQRPEFVRGNVMAAAVAAALSMAWPGAAAAQTVVGQASGVRSTTVALFGPSTVVLADTGAALVDHSRARCAKRRVAEPSASLEPGERRAVADRNGLPDS